MGARCSQHFLLIMSFCTLHSRRAPRLHGQKGKLLGAHAGTHGAEPLAGAPQADHLWELNARRLRDSTSLTTHQGGGCVLRPIHHTISTRCKAAIELAELCFCDFEASICNNTTSKTVCCAVRSKRGAAQAACAASLSTVPRQNTSACGKLVAELHVLLYLPPLSRQGWGRSRGLVRSCASCTGLSRYEPSSIARCPLLSPTYADAAAVWLPVPVERHLVSKLSETTAQEHLCLALQQ